MKKIYCQPSPNGLTDPGSQNRYGVIYAGFCTASGKYYVGQTIQKFAQRRKAHKTSSKCPLLYNAVKKHGWDSFVWTIVSIIYSGQEELNMAEGYWQQYLDSRCPNGYNLEAKLPGSGGLHESTKKKIGAASKGRQPWMSGKTHTKESKELMSVNRSGSLNHMFGKHISNKQKEQIRIAQKKYWANPEYVARHSKITKDRGLIGELAPSVKITKEQAIEIFISTKTQKELADQFGLVQPHVSRIKRGVIWSHVTNGLVRGVWKPVGPT